MPESFLRIGELSARSGVPVETLRAWERRYRLFSPARTDGGFRLYSDADVAVVMGMREQLANGVAASEAARRLLAESPAGSAPPPELGRLGDAFHRALRELDDGQLQLAFDRLLGGADIETAILEVFIPELRALGEEWAAGTLSIAQEHFAVAVLRGRLLGLARGWDAGFGPRAVLACPPGEDHDLPLVMFGLLLRRRGWRVTFLGANTPFEQIATTASRVAANLVVLFSPFGERFLENSDALRTLASAHPVLIAGAGAAIHGAADLGCILQPGPPNEVADAVSAWAATSRPAASASSPVPETRHR